MSLAVSERQCVLDDCGCNRKRATMVVRRYDGTNSSDDRRRRRADWNKPAPCHADAAHDMPFTQVWNLPAPGEVASIISRGHRSRGHMDEVETPNELQR